PTGDPHGKPPDDDDNGDDHHPPHRRHHPPHGEERIGHTGKVAGLIFDRFGDFDGFVLQTAEAERRYVSREHEIELLAERAWRARLRITVFSERDEPKRVALIEIWEPPAAI